MALFSSVVTDIKQNVFLGIFFFFCTELNTGQIQECIGEAVNGIVKHFHKPEKEVRVSNNKT